jgi:hypothetical protein
MPFFSKHSRIAEKRAPPRPATGAGVLDPVDEVPVDEVPFDAEPVDAALALVDVVLDEPPHAAKPKQASSRTMTAAAAGLWLRVLGWGMKLLCRLFGLSTFALLAPK